MTLVLDNVKKKYKAFELDLSLTLEPGTITGLIGRNGAGKSTTFKAILGLIKLTDGKVLIDGKEPQNLKPADKEKIGVVLSDSGFSGYMTVKDVIATMNAMYKKFDKADFMAKCEHFKIPLNQKIKEFSTGMKAKLKVLLAMSYEAKLLILDEPTSGLDVVVRNQILDMLREYMEDGNKGILISSHISSDLEGICDELYMIDNGHIVMHEETDVLLSEYGVLKVTPEQYEKIDKQYILKVKKEQSCYRCLTTQKMYYMENYPELIVENGSIDELMVVMNRGEEV